MKRLLLCLFVCITLFACKKDKIDSKERSYFLKLKVGQHSKDISLTDEEIAGLFLKENRLIVFETATYGSDFNQIIISVPGTRFGLNLPSLDRGSYQSTGRHNLYAFVSAKSADGGIWEWPYQTNSLTSADTKVSANITTSNRSYIEGNFEGIVHGKEYSTHMNGTAVVVPIEGSFRVKRKQP